MLFCNFAPLKASEKKAGAGEDGNKSLLIGGAVLLGLGALGLWYFSSKGTETAGQYWAACSAQCRPKCTPSVAPPFADGRAARVSSPAAVSSTSHTSTSSSSAAAPAHTADPELSPQEGEALAELWPALSLLLTPSSTLGCAARSHELSQIASDHYRNKEHRLVSDKRLYILALASPPTDTYFSSQQAIKVFMEAIALNSANFK